MGVNVEGSVQATATLAEVEDQRRSPAGRQAGLDSRFRPGLRPTSSLTADAMAAALQRRIGAPRGSAAGGAPEAATTARERPRSRRTRGGEPVPAPPAPSPPAVPARPSRVRDPERHLFSDTVSVTVGPFENLDAIGEFAETLSSLAGVGSVRIRTFDRSSVVFDVDLTEPTAVIARLRGQSHRLLRLLYAGERIIRLKLV